MIFWHHITDTKFIAFPLQYVTLLNSLQVEKIEFGTLGLFRIDHK